MNKNYLYLGLIVAVIATGAFLYIKQGNQPDVVLTSPSPTPTETPTPTPTNIPSKTSKPSASPQPTPGIKAEDNNYKYLSDQFDNDGNRRLIINDDCTQIVPSQVAYKNGVQIMLDNTYSTHSHILKIGTYEFSLDAGAWFLTTLSSPTLPARLPIFCGSMELGAIELD